MLGHLAAAITGRPAVMSPDSIRRHLWFVKPQASPGWTNHGKRIDLYVVAYRAAAGERLELVQVVDGMSSNLTSQAMGTPGVSDPLSGWEHALASLRSHGIEPTIEVGAD